MAEITTLFWDVGGVILTNAWDREARKRAVERFDLEAEQFEERHELINNDFEEGRLALEQYLDWALFHQPRPFTREQFKAFMFSQSEPLTECLAIVAALAGSGRCRMATLNNESLELNRYRIERFRLRDYFNAFFSSCFLGVRKPRREIYHRAVEILQSPLENCLFIDDRKLNVECAQLLGMRAIHFLSADQLKFELARFGVEV